MALFRFLSYRPRTRFETFKKYISLGGLVDQADMLLEEYEELGLIDDQKFALDFIDVRLRSKKHGPLRIRRDLIKKGVSKELIEDGLAKLVTEELEVEAATKAIPLRWIRKPKPLSASDMQKLKATLYRRGFSYGVVAKALQSIQ